MKRLALAVGACLLLGFALIGCGGGGGNSAPPAAVETTNINITINWGARSRALEAPSSALSATITLKGANPAGGDFAFTVDRAASTAAYSKTYVSNGLAKTGTWQLAVRFCSQPGGAGSVVGSIDAGINLKADGTGIASFDTEGKVAAVAIAPAQAVAVGQTTDLAVTATDVGGALLALAPGAVFLQVTAGSDKLQVTAQQQVKGLAVGSATAVATVDGVSSAPQTVTVGYSPAVTVTPAEATTLLNGSLHFAATVTGTPATSVIWSVQEGPAGGTITDTGDYAAPAVPGTYHVVASSRVDTTRQAVATVVVSATVPPAAGVYVADGSRIIRMDDMTGAHFTSIGTYGTGRYQFRGIGGIYVTANGTIYVSDNNNSRIVRMDDMTGANWTTFGTSGSGVGQFEGPTSVFVAADGRIYVTDTANSRIVRMDDFSGAGWVTYGTRGAGTGQFSTPRYCAVGPDNRIYVADQANYRIVRFDDMVGANWQSHPAGSPISAAIGPSGELAWVAWSIGSSNGAYATTSFTDTSRTDLAAAVGGFGGSPQGVWIGPDGRVYVWGGTLFGVGPSAIHRLDDVSGTNPVSFGSSTYGSGIGQFSSVSGIFVR